jgi:hypothetical protein
MAVNGASAARMRLSSATVWLRSVLGARQLKNETAAHRTEPSAIDNCAEGDASVTPEHSRSDVSSAMAPCGSVLGTSHHDRPSRPSLTTTAGDAAGVPTSASTSRLQLTRRIPAAARRRRLSGRCGCE